MVSPTKNSNPAAGEKFWAVVPAAGVGARMASDRPKQYLPLAGKTVIEHSLDRLLNHSLISGAVVAISEADEYWSELGSRYTQQSAKPLHIAPGGAERCDSVLNALRVLAAFADENDWVLVHDAARPCLRPADIDTLIQQCQSHPVGGILAVPVKDTIKQADANGAIKTTVDRDSLWHAQTPQMFRLGSLRDALERALAEGAVITDEASALEHVGRQPLLVEGHADNLKITRPEDLPLAEFYFSRL
jgi:2-C-methyl-D-erythritol 4-phosphate cytidylyltransferase